jgi:hypothetical protein
MFKSMCLATSLGRRSGLVLIETPDPSVWRACVAGSPHEAFFDPPLQQVRRGYELMGNVAACCNETGLEQPLCQSTLTAETRTERCRVLFLGMSIRALWGLEIRPEKKKERQFRSLPAVFSLRFRGKHPGWGVTDRRQMDNNRIQKAPSWRGCFTNNLLHSPEDSRP